MNADTPPAPPTNRPKSDIFLTTAEMAAVFGVSDATVRRHAEQHGSYSGITAIRSGHMWRFVRSQLTAITEGRVA